MLIFMVTNNYTPYSGGVVSALKSYSHALRTLGHRIIIITLDFTAIPDNESDVIRLYCPIRFIYCKNHMAIPWGATQELYRLVLYYKPDIIHAHHPFLLGTSALKVAKKLHIPVVFTHHTLYEQYVHYTCLPTFFIKPVIRALVRSFCSQVDALIVPSKSIKDYLIEQNIAQKGIIIPTGILPLFIQEQCIYKSKVKRLFKLLTVSRFMPEKNISFLLTMFYELACDTTHSYTLTLAGYGAYLDYLQNYAYNQLQLSQDRVHFIVNPTKKELVELYKSADVFVFASQSETQGLVLAEAMAQATPVIGLDASGTRDIVVSGKNGILVTSCKEMVKAIIKIAHDTLLHKQMQYQAWLTSQNYCPKYCAHKLINVYENLLKDYQKI